MTVFFDFFFVFFLVLKNVFDAYSFNHIFKYVIIRKNVEFLVSC